MNWTRDAISARVDKLAAEHEGEELVAAMRAFAEQLDDGGRELLGRILLERAPRRKGVTTEYPKWSVILPRPKRRRAE